MFDIAKCRDCPWASLNNPRQSLIYRCVCIENTCSVECQKKTPLRRPASSVISFLLWNLLKKVIVERSICQPRRNPPLYPSLCPSTCNNPLWNVQWRVINCCVDDVNLHFNLRAWIWIPFLIASSAVQAQHVRWHEWPIKCSRRICYCVACQSIWTSSLEERHRHTDKDGALEVGWLGWDTNQLTSYL